MRRARRLHDLPSSSEDDNDFEEKASSSSGSTSNLSSLYDANDEEGPEMDDEELLDEEEEGDDEDFGKADSCSLTTASSSSEEEEHKQRTTRRQRNAASSTRQQNASSSSTTAATRGGGGSNGNSNTNTTRIPANRRRRGRMGRRSEETDSDASDSPLSYDSSESAMSGDVRVSDVLMRGGDITSRRTRDATAAVAAMTRRQLLGEDAGPAPTRQRRNGGSNGPRRGITAGREGGYAADRRRGGASSAASNHHHHSSGRNRSAAANVNGGEANDEGEFVRTDSIIEEFDSDDDRAMNGHRRGGGGGHHYDDDDSSDDDDDDSDESSIDYDAEEGSEDDDDSVSDDEADFQPAPEEIDEDEEEENVLFDLSERLGGSVAAAQSSIKPLLQVVRTIIKMEKAMSTKTDQLKALETRRQTEQTVAAADDANATNNNNTTATADATTINPTTTTSTSTDNNNNNTTAAASSPSAPPLLTTDQQIAEVKHFLAEVKPLLTDQWAIATRLIHVEFLRSTDTYSQSLDFQDRGGFERVTRILLGREELFEIIDGHLLVGDMNEDIPRYAAFVAYMVSEGTREPVFGATAVDLFPIVLSDPSRLKRIVALTSLFTLLDKEYEEERTITDLLASDVPRAMLMRIKEYYPVLMQPYRQFTSSHLMNYNTTTSADDGEYDDYENNDNPMVAPNSVASIHRALARTSTGTVVMVPESGNESGLVSDNINHHNNNSAVDDDDTAGTSSGGIPLPPAFHLPTADSNSNHTTNNNALSSSLMLGPYIPRLGDIVTRGPNWAHGEQDHGCKRGVIMAIVSKGPDDGDEEEIINNGLPTEDGDDANADKTSSEDDDDDEDPLAAEIDTYTVLVRWDPDDDITGGSTKRRVNKSLRGKLYKYRCGGFTHREVVSLQEYRKINMFDLNSHDFKLDEFYLMTAIIGVLSHKKPMVSLIVEHRILEGMVSILQSSLRYGALMQEIVLARISNCNLDSDEEALEFNWYQSHLQPPAVEKAVKVARTWRELTARALWVLNGAISHKQLGSMFLRLDGLPPILALANSYPSVVSHRYGCGLVFSQLAKTQLLSEVVAAGRSDNFYNNSNSNNTNNSVANANKNDEELLPQLLKTCHKLFESANHDIKQAVATCYYCGLSYVPFLRQFDADGAIVGIVRELKLALGLQGVSKQLLPADQRPVEIDMFVNKNAHLINMYLRAIYVYLSSHLLQLGMVLFRRQRTSNTVNVNGGGGGGYGGSSSSFSLGGMERMASFAGGDSQVLPRDDTALEAVIAALHQPDESPEDTNATTNGGGASSNNGLNPTTPTTSGTSFGASFAGMSTNGGHGGSFSSNAMEHHSHNSNNTSTNPRREYVAHSLISTEQWKPFRVLVDEFRLHELLLLIVQTFETHRKRDVRMSALNVLYVLSVAPCTRSPIAECFIESPDSIDEFRASAAAAASPQKHRGIKVLLQVTEESDLTGKEAVLANIKSLNVLSLLMLPPLSVVTGYSVASFDRVSGTAGLVIAPAAVAGASAGVDAAASYATICSLFRACDGVKTLLALKLPSAETSIDLSNLMPLHFYMFAAQVFIFSSLRYFGDTPQLFSVLGVRKLAVDLQIYFRQFRQQSAANNTTSEPLTVRTFMNNCLALATGSVVAGGAGLHPNNNGGNRGGGGASNNGANADDVDPSSPHRSGGGGDSSSVVGGLLTGCSGVNIGGTTHFDADGQERQYVIEHSYLDYKKDSLLELIARHLESEGLVAAADILRKEADLPEPEAIGGGAGEVLAGGEEGTVVNPSVGIMAVSTPASGAGGEFPRGSSPLLTANSNNTQNGASSHNNNHHQPSVGSNHSTSVNASASAAALAAAQQQQQRPNNTTTLDGIIRSFLRQTQENCARPIATLPKIDLLRNQPIVGFDYAPPLGGRIGASAAGMDVGGGCLGNTHNANSYYYAYYNNTNKSGGGVGSNNSNGYYNTNLNISSSSASRRGGGGFGFVPFRGVTPQPSSLSNRLFNRKMGLKQWTGCLTDHYRQVHKSRFPIYELRNTSNDDFDLAVVDFCDYGESVIAAGTDGTLVIFSHSERGAVKETHFIGDDSETMFMDISPDCQMVMCVNREGVGKVLRREALSSPSPYTFTNASAAMFSPIGNRIAATYENDDVGILDVATGSQLDLLSGMEGASNNHLNVGTFDITGTLILNHGTLFDLRQANRPVFRFDCVSEHFSGIFHPSGLSVVVDGNLWDLRTMSTVLSCPALLNSLPQCGRIGTHFYAPVINTEASHPLGIVNVVESRTLNLITTFQLDPHLETFALDVYTEGSFATVNECADADKMLKVYQIGRYSDASMSASARQLTVPQTMGMGNDEGDDLMLDDDDDLLGDDDDDLDDDEEDDDEDFGEDDDDDVEDDDEDEDDLYENMTLDSDDE